MFLYTRFTTACIGYVNEMRLLIILAFTLKIDQLMWLGAKWTRIVKETNDSIGKVYGILFAI